MSLVNLQDILSRTRNGGSAAGLGARLTELSWPTSRDAEFNYSNMSRFESVSFQSADQDIGIDTWNEFLVKEVEPFFKNYFVFKNGVLARAKTNLKLQQKATPVPLLNVSPGGFVFEPLNALLCDQTQELVISDAADIALIFIGDSADSMANTSLYGARLDVRLEKSAKARIFEWHVSRESSGFVSHSVHFFLAEGAELEHSCLQNSSDVNSGISERQFFLQKDAQLKTIQVDLGGKFVRNNLRISLEDSGADALSRGLFIAKSAQHFDNNCVIHHKATATKSDQYYKGILADESRGVFSGLIRMDRSAAKSDARQVNKNVSLSSQAEVDSQPQLEIDVDDVKASHGATSGQIDREQYFYLLSRALSKSTALQLLLEGQAFDALDAFSPVTQTVLKKQISLKLSEIDAQAQSLVWRQR